MSVPAGRESFDSAMIATGKEAGLIACLPRVNREQLVSLSGQNGGRTHTSRGGARSNGAGSRHGSVGRDNSDRAGAMFSTSDLPSCGELTVEADRSIVRDIERAIRAAYCSHALDHEVRRVQKNKSALGGSTPRGSMVNLLKSIEGKFTGTSGSEGAKNNVEFCLAGKQLHCAEVPLVVKALRTLPEDRVGTLRLCDNSIGTQGLRVLLRDYFGVLEIEMGGVRRYKKVTTLDLSGNPLGSEGASVFADAVDLNDLAVATLILDKTQLGRAGAKAVAKWLPLATNLREISMESNGIGDSGAAALIDAMRKHGTVVVKLKDKGISESVMEKVKSVCLHNVMSRGNAAVI